MLNGPLTAETASADHQLNFRRIFHGQFTLSQSSTLAVTGYHCRDLGQGWKLHFCRSLSTARVYDTAKNMLGMVLGIAVDANGTLIKDGHILPDGETPEQFIIGTGGRYVAIFITPDAQHVYADPTGSMGLVFDASTQTVASTPLMCLDRPMQDNPRYDVEVVQAGRGTFSLGHTRDAHVNQVMPNHNLDLNDFRLTRFWPTEDATIHATKRTGQQAVGTVTSRLSHIIGAIAGGHDSLLPISGGRDSRNLIACGKEHLGKIKMFFTFVQNWQATIDDDLAKKIADTYGQPHTTIASYHEGEKTRQSVPRRARMRKRIAFRLAGGFVGDANNDVLDGLTDHLPPGVLIRGNVMEILKANHWKTGLRRDKEHPSGHDADYATRRLAINPAKEDETVAEFLPDYLAWYESLPKGVRHLAYDFAFIEMLLPGWQPKFYGYTKNFIVNPYSDRALIWATLHMPVRGRLKNVFNDAVLAKAAPELTELPFTNEVKRTLVEANRAAG